MAETTINKDTFKVEKLAATVSLSLLTRLTKILGPGLSAINNVFDADEGRRDAAALAALAAIVEKTDETQFQKLVIEVTEYAQIKLNGAYEPVVFDHHFTGDLLTAFKVFIWVLEVQFKSFFGEAMGSALVQKVIHASTKGSSEG